MQEHVQS